MSFIGFCDFQGSNVLTDFDSTGGRFTHTATQVRANKGHSRSTVAHLVECQLARGKEGVVVDTIVGAMFCN